MVCFTIEELQETLPTLSDDELKLLYSKTKEIRDRKKMFFEKAIEKDASCVQPKIEYNPLNKQDFMAEDQKLIDDSLIIENEMMRLE